LIRLPSISLKDRVANFILGVETRSRADCCLGVASEMQMRTNKTQSEGRTKNAAVPASEMTKGAQTDNPVGRKPKAGQSTENAGMGAKGLGKTH
jgi:hypothetical protein